MLFLLADGKAEIAELASECEVFAVRICRKSALLEVELALAVDIALVDVDADYLREEHGMRAEQLALGDAAFEADGALLDNRGADLMCGEHVQSARREFIDVPAAFNAAEVGRLHHCGGGEVDDELARIPDDVVGVALGTDGDIGHWRTSADDACPADSEDVGFVGGAAGDEGGGYGREQSAALPELLRHRTVPFGW